MKTISEQLSENKQGDFDLRNNRWSVIFVRGILQEGVQNPSVCACEKMPVLGCSRGVRRAARARREPIFRNDRAWNTQSVWGTFRGASKPFRPGGKLSCREIKTHLHARFHARPLG